jgi:CheY-like chemotaxis protein
MPDEELSAERYAVLSVADTGLGIDPAIRSQIFDPFFTTKPVGQGTGLGLATVYGIVMQLGGTLRVHSEAGRGSTFEVYLPLEEDSAGEVFLSPAPRAAAPGTGRTVLLAEDEPALRALAQRVLRGAGYQLIIAEDGYAALEAARAHSGAIDLLISDVVMPRLSGLELATILLSERPQLRVLLLSGYPQRAAPESAVLLGDVPFLAKPFVPDDLLSAAHRALTEQ